MELFVFFGIFFSHWDFLSGLVSLLALTCNLMLQIFKKVLMYVCRRSYLQPSRLRRLLSRWATTLHWKPFSNMCWNWKSNTALPCRRSQAWPQWRKSSYRSDLMYWLPSIANNCRCERAEIDLIRHDDFFPVWLEFVLLATHFISRGPHYVCCCKTHKKTKHCCSWCKDLTPFH